MLRKNNVVWFLVFIVIVLGVLVYLQSKKDLYSGLVEKDSFREILVRANTPDYGYQGIVELEGYLTTTERPTTLLPEPTTTCAAFQVTGGPENAVAYLTDRSAAIESNIIILGKQGAELQNPWWNTPDIATSTASSPVRAVFRIGSKFESAAVGCFDPFVAFIGTIPE